MLHLFDGTFGCCMCGFGGSGGGQLVWFWGVRIDTESSDIASDVVDGRLGFLWDVDAQIKCHL